MKFLCTHLLLRSEENLKNYNRGIIESFLRNLRIKGVKRVLDFGAGIGTLSTLFYCVTGLKPECMEIDPEQKFLIENRGFRAYSTLNEIDGKFDLIFTSNVLEHIEDDLGTLRELKSKLTDNGHLAIYVPAFEEIWSQSDVLAGHYRRYKKGSLEQILKSAGYRVSHIRYDDSLGFMLSYLFRYLGDKHGEPSGMSLKVYDTLILPFSKLTDFLVLGKFGKNLMAIATLSEALQDFNK